MFAQTSSCNLNDPPEPPYIPLTIYQILALQCQFEQLKRRKHSCGKNCIITGYFLMIFAISFCRILVRLSRLIRVTVAPPHYTLWVSQFRVHAQTYSGDDSIWWIKSQSDKWLWSHYCVVSTLDHPEWTH